MLDIAEDIFSANSALAMGSLPTWQAQKLGLPSVLHCYAAPAAQ